MYAILIIVICFHTFIFCSHCPKEVHKWFRRSFPSWNRYIHGCSTAIYKWKFCWRLCGFHQWRVNRLSQQHMCTQGPQGAHYYLFSKLCVPPTAESCIWRSFAWRIHENEQKFAWATQKTGEASIHLWKERSPKMPIKLKLAFKLTCDIHQKVQVCVSFGNVCRRAEWSAQTAECVCDALLVSFHGGFYSVTVKYQPNWKPTQLTAELLVLSQTDLITAVWCKQTHACPPALGGETLSRCPMDN